MTNRKHRFMVSDQLSEMGVECNVGGEPEGKNTLSAIYLGVKEMVKEDHCTVAVLPSDHIVDAGKDYVETFRKAERLGKSHLVTFGITPSSPHTGYGYIKPGESLGDGYRVERFVEKPSKEKAERYVAEGYLWNSGMFLFRSDVFLEECSKIVPEVVRAFNSDIFGAYSSLPELSIDHGIMEKTDRAVVVPLNVFWSDVGSFDSLYDLMEKNGDGNAVRGEHIGMDSTGNLIIGERLIATIGVRDMAIVETRDAVLITPRDQAQKIRDVVGILKERGDERAEFHTTVYRP